MQELQIYYKLIKISMKGRMQYRADFITGIISVILLNAVQLSLIGILVSKFTRINGWGGWELVLLYGVWMLGHSIYSLFFWHLNTLEDQLIQGTFDQYLLRPLGPLIQFLGREIQYMGIGDVLVGMGCISLAYSQLGLHWDLGHWCFILMAVASGTIIEFSLSLMIASLSFWFGRSRAAFFLFLRLNVLTQQYPIDLFGGWFRVVVTGLLPVAFMNYYPTLALIGKARQLGAWEWLCYVSPLVASLLLIAASQLWRLAIRRYSSAGG
jgi:ABC-2 type transport system permease protein